MYKFFVVSCLVLGATAVPYNNYANYASTGYSGAAYAAPKVALVSNGYSGAAYGQGLASGASYGQGLALNGGLLRSGHVAGSSGLAFGGASSGLAFGANSGLALGHQQQQVNQFGLLTVHQSQPFEAVVPAAIQQLGRTVEYRAVPNVEQPIQAQVIEVEPSDNPVHLHFKTRSSTLSLSQSHTPLAAPEVQTAQEQDEPARLITEVQKPVIQEVREVISPYRQVTQEINPVQESLHQIVTKGEGQRAQYAGANYGAQYASGNKYASVAVAQPAYAQSAYAQSAYAAPASIQTSYVAKPALATSAYQSNLLVKPIQTASYQSNLLVKPLAKVQSSYTASAPVAVAADGY